MQILMTRPEGYGESLKKALVNKGVIVEHIPTMEIKAIQHPKKIQSSNQSINDLEQFQHIIFISSNAVLFAMELLDRNNKSIPHSTCCHAIGKATAKSLLKYSIDVADVMSIHDSESLLTSPLLQSVEGQNILIFRGCRGREYLANALRLRGANVHYAELYQRLKADENATKIQNLLKNNSLDACIVLSGDTVKYTQQLSEDFSPILLNLPLIVPSDRIAQLAIRSGFNQVIHMKPVNEENIVNYLISLTPKP